jgi:hypothetical protein
MAKAEAKAETLVHTHSTCLHKQCTKPISISCHSACLTFVCAHATPQSTLVKHANSRVQDPSRHLALALVTQTPLGVETSPLHTPQALHSLHNPATPKTPLCSHSIDPHPIRPSPTALALAPVRPMHHHQTSHLPHPDPLPPYLPHALAPPPPSPPPLAPYTSPESDSSLLDHQSSPTH